MKKTLLAAVVVAAMSTGCASYRTDSNISTNDAPAVVSTKKVLISEDAMPGRKYTTIGPIEVTVKKLTLFHADPTKEQANEVFVEKARSLNADAVVSVTYESGIGFGTWGKIEGKGLAVKFIE